MLDPTVDPNRTVRGAPILVASDPHIKLMLGNGQLWDDASIEVDLIFTNPYCPLPKALHKKPAIVSMVKMPPKAVEGWLGLPLRKIGHWGTHLHNTLYVAGLPVPSYIDTTDYDITPPWFPYEMAEDMLLHARRELGKEHLVVWDGAMGRGTVGRACRNHGCYFIGIDQSPERLVAARRYLRI